MTIFNLTTEQGQQIAVFASNRTSSLKRIQRHIDEACRQADMAFEQTCDGDLVYWNRMSFIENMLRKEDIYRLTVPNVTLSPVDE